MNSMTLAAVAATAALIAALVYWVSRDAERMNAKQRERVARLQARRKFLSRLINSFPEQYLPPRLLALLLERQASVARTLVELVKESASRAEFEHELWALEEKLAAQGPLESDTTPSRNPQLQPSELGAVRRSLRKLAEQLDHWSQQPSCQHHDWPQLYASLEQLGHETSYQTHQSEAAQRKSANDLSGALHHLRAEEDALHRLPAAHPFRSSSNVQRVQQEIRELRARIAAQQPLTSPTVSGSTDAHWKKRQLYDD
ncbi:MAG: hypothetical protein SV583_09520 [Pseudomonadota bacterium]|nr:hypothetical protein [Pseudomonadota bacterium]